MPSLHEFRTILPLARAKPSGLADFGAPLLDTTVGKTGRLHKFAQILSDGQIGRRFQDLRVTAIRTVEAGIASAKVFVDFEVFGDNTAAPASGAGFAAALYAGAQQLTTLSSGRLYLPYGNFWYQNRFVFEVPVADFDQADRFEFIAKPEEVRAIVETELSGRPDQTPKLAKPGANHTEPGCTTYPLVKRVQHRMLGELLRMMLSEQVSYDLTLEEGRTLSRAFTALAHDWRRNDSVYLSPIGMDGDFSAAVTQDGLDVETAETGHHLSWHDVTELAERLAVE